jgi:hypothetical protein
MNLVEAGGRYSEGLLVVQDFSLLHSAQTDSGPTQPPIQWVPVALSRGVKRQGLEADYPPPSSAEVKKVGAIPPLPHVFMP